MTDKELKPLASTCSECGMPIQFAGEYHPYAACLMFKACHNSETVRKNLEAIRHPAPDSVPDCCGNPAQCWEPCGELGKSEAHVRVSDIELPKADSVPRELVERMVRTLTSAEEIFDLIQAAPGSGFNEARGATGAEICAETLADYRKWEGK